MLFGELASMVEFLLGELLQEKNQTKCRHLYQIYLALETVISDCHTILNHYLTVPMEAHFLQNSSFGTPYDKWKVVLEKDFDRLDKSIVEFIRAIEFWILATDDEHNLYFMVASPKNPLSSHFQDACCSGRIQSDVLMSISISTAFLMKAPKLPHRLNQDLRTDRMEIDTLNKRLALKDKGKQNLKRIKQIKNQLSEHILENCTLNEMV